MSGTRTYYEVLDVPKDAPSEDVRSSYRRLVRAVHPDTGGSAALLHVVREAYEVLADVERRAAYDAELAAPARVEGCRRCAELDAAAAPVAEPQDERPPVRIFEQRKTAAQWWIEALLAAQLTVCGVAVLSAVTLS